MGGRYKAYPEYKDSGVEWLGKIPSHWSVVQLKRTVEGCVNGIWGSEPEGGENDLIVVRVADFDRVKLRLKEGDYTYRKILPKEKSSRLLSKGDLLLEKSGGGERTLVGQVVLFDNDFKAVTSNFVAKMTPVSGVDSRYLNFVFSHFYNKRINFCSINQNTGIQNLDSEAYLSEKFGFPEKSEQLIVANFLDHETAKIDTLIEKQQQLIQLLKEKRQAVISHAVTKGLNPNAKMRDSGVEWLGEVPEHWRVVKFNYCTSIRNGQVDPRESPYKEMVLYAPNHIEKATGKVLLRESAEEQGADSGKYLCLQDEVMYSKIRPALAKVAICTEEKALCSADMYPIQGSNGLQNGFLYWLLLSEGFTSEVVLDSDRVAMPKVNRETLSLYRLPLPSEIEQLQISNYLAVFVEQIDSLVERAEHAIKLASERRTALISAAVTGKIDVRDWVPPTSGHRSEEAA